MRRSTRIALLLAVVAACLVPSGCRRGKTPAPAPQDEAATAGPSTRPTQPTASRLTDEGFGVLLGEYAKAHRPPVEVAQDARFGRYLDTLAVADVEASEGHGRVALLLNAHSAFLIQAASDPGVEAGTLGQRPWPLEELEREAMAATDAPEVVFALARADSTGPNLRPGAYLAGALAEQLREDASAFIRGVGAPRVDRQYAVVYLSPVFQAGADGPMDEDEALWLVREYCESPDVVDVIDSGSFSVEHEPYGAAAPLAWMTLPNDTDDSP